MQFIVGEEVEVFYVLERNKLGKVKVGGWIPAAITEVYGSKYEVETMTQLEINREKLHVGASDLRPRPPLEEENLEEGQVIEMRPFNHDLWITGKVWEDHHHHHHPTAAGTTTMSYSVLALYADHPILKRYTVSRSEVRVHRQWMDGEWVPPPPQVHLHQDSVVPSTKSGDSSVGRDHSSEQWRYKERPALQLRGLGSPHFNIGAQVEIFEEFMGMWKKATVLELQADQIRVRHTVWSWIYDSTQIEKFYDVFLARPLPPKIKDEKTTFHLHQQVEVYHDDHWRYSGVGGWYVGEVLEICRNTKGVHYYSISHPKLGIIDKIKESEIRVRQEWVDGKWVQPPSILYTNQQLKPRQMEEGLSIGAEVEVYSLYHKGWISGIIKGLAGNQIEVEVTMRDDYNDDEIEMWILLVDASRIRPRLSAEKDTNCIFKENELVEVLQPNGSWKKGEIWETLYTMKSLFYSIKVVDSGGHMEVDNVSKSKVRVRRKWVEGKWSEPSFVQHCISSFSPESVRGNGASDNMRSIVWTVVKERKLEDTKFCIGAEVEGFNDYKGGWLPGTIVELRGNEIGVKHQWKEWQRFYDATMVRPKPPMKEEGSHHIFQIHDEVEAFYDDDQIWCVGQILEVQSKGNTLFYSVSHPTLGFIWEEDIRVHWEWRDGEWNQPHSDPSVHHHHQRCLQLLRELNMDKNQFTIGAEVEVYSLRSCGWHSGTISKLCENHIEVEAEAWIDEEKWRIHVDASKIRPPPPPKVENDPHLFNYGDFIEVYSDYCKVWQKGEICGSHSKENYISYSIFVPSSRIVTVSKSKMRIRREWVPETGWRPIPNRTLTKVVDEEHNAIFPTVEVGISNTNVLVDASSSIKPKVTHTKTDITWKHCKHLDHMTRKGKFILQCNYCKQRYQGGGIHRMKQHLGHQEKGDATPCLRVPSPVRNQIQNDLRKVSKGKKVKRGNASKVVQGKYKSSTSTRSFAKFKSKGDPRSTKSPIKCDPFVKTITDGDKDAQTSSKGDHYQEIFFVDAIRGKGREDISPIVNEESIKDGPTGNAQLPSTCVAIEQNQNIEKNGHQASISSKRKQFAQDGAPISCQKLRQVPTIQTSSSPHITQTKTIINDGKGVQSSGGISGYHEEDKFANNIGEGGREYAGKVSDVSMIDKMEEVIYTNIGQRKYEASKFSIPVSKSPTNHASLLENIILPTVDKQGIEVEEITHANQQKDVQGYKIPTNVQSTYDLIKYRYGDIFRDCIVDKEEVRSIWTNEMCEVVQQMQITTYDNVSEDMIDKWYKVCLVHNAVKIDNEWLMRRFEEIKNFIKAQMQVLELENSEKKIKDEIKKIDKEIERLYSERGKLVDNLAIVETKRGQIAHELSKVSCPNQSVINGLL